MRKPRSLPSRSQSATFAVVAPSLARARAAARQLRGHWGAARLVPLSLETFLEGSALVEVLLCPAGRDVQADVDFLARARDRILWPAPGEDLRGAIDGLRGEPASSARGIRKPAQSATPRDFPPTGLLLEGRVTRGRARAALASDTRHWIVERPQAVELGRRELTRLARQGVHWSALDPVRLVAVLASARLAAAKRLWRGTLPAGTRIRVLKA